MHVLSKRCRKCEQVQPISEFGKDKRSPDGRAPRCRTCRSAYDKALRKRLSEDPDWVQRRREKERAKYAADPERGRERTRRWRSRHPERDAESAKRSREKQLAKDPDYFRRWARENAERHRANSRRSMRKWRRENPEAAKAAKARYRSRHPGRVKAIEREKTYSRRAKMTYSPELAEFMRELVTKPCAYCGATEKITVDHVVPLSRGGKHEQANLAPACFSCNSSKGARTLNEWPGPPSKSD